MLPCVTTRSAEYAVPAVLEPTSVHRMRVSDLELAVELLQASNTEHAELAHTCRASPHPPNTQ